MKGVDKVGTTLQEGKVVEGFEKANTGLTKTVERSRFGSDIACQFEWQFCNVMKGMRRSLL